MAHLIVSAAATITAEGAVIVVAVSGSEDGLPRTGLAGGDFVVHRVPDIGSAVPATLPIDRAIEGPEGCYSLVLAPITTPEDESRGGDIFSVAVLASTEAGWADERGLTLAVNHGR